MQLEGLEEELKAVTEEGGECGEGKIKAEKECTTSLPQADLLLSLTGLRQRVIDAARSQPELKLITDLIHEVQDACIFYVLPACDTGCAYCLCQ